MNRNRTDRPVVTNHAACLPAPARSDPWRVAAGLLALALIVSIAGGCRDRPVAGGAAHTGVSPAAGGGGTLAPALPTTVATPGLPRDLALTATALFRRLASTPPPRAPRACGASAAEAAFIEVSRADATTAPDSSAGFAPAHGGARRQPEVAESPFVDVQDAPLSTFAVDVDTASYADVRCFLTEGSLPPAGAVRIEELLNAFTYSYPEPPADDPSPLAVYAEVVDAPWRDGHRLVHLAIRARGLPARARQPANLVFLVDVSGSMADATKLPLVKAALRLLLEELRPDDSVAIVTYADTAGMVLPPTLAGGRAIIEDAIDRLAVGGSTDGAGGIRLAYDQAAATFVHGGVNRVVLATDGEFNVGITDAARLRALIARQADRGVRLSVLGFGTGNARDATLEMLADSGDGTYARIDTIDEARRALATQLDASLTVVAEDVKVQVEFNPAEADSYRLIGYDDRRLAPRDLGDDAMDAGAVGARHAVTVLYEVVPRAGGAGDALASPASEATAADASAPLRYQQARALTEEARSGELLTVRVRYRLPTDAPDTPSTWLVYPVVDRGLPIVSAHPDVRFAAAVAEWGMLLRDSPYKGDATWRDVVSLAASAVGADADGARAALVDLVERSERLAASPGVGGDG